MTPNSHDYSASNGVSRPIWLEWLSNRVVFLLVTFLMMMLAFYVGLVVNAFSTPYLKPYLGITFFANFWLWALMYSGFILLVVSIFTATIPNFGRRHYFGVLALSGPATFCSWYFFVAFFGI